MALQWPTPNKTIHLRGVDNCTYLGVCPFTGRHRVFDNQPRAGSKGTVWRLTDDGRCRGDKADSEHDFLGEVA